MFSHGIMATSYVTIPKIIWVLIGSVTTFFSAYNFVDAALDWQALKQAPKWREKITRLWIVARANILQEFSRLCSSISILLSGCISMFYKSQKPVGYLQVIVAIMVIALAIFNMFGSVVAANARRQLIKFRRPYDHHEGNLYE